MVDELARFRRSSTGVLLYALVGIGVLSAGLLAFATLPAGVGFALGGICGTFALKVSIEEIARRSRLDPEEALRLSRKARFKRLCIRAVPLIIGAASPHVNFAATVAGVFFPNIILLIKGR